MFNVFGSNHTVIGLLDLNLILNTAGKIKIRYGNKFIDLLDNEGNINAPLPKFILKIESEDLMKSNCFYLLDDVLYLKYQDLVMEVSNLKVGYLEYTNPLELTKELIKTVQNNIGLTFDSTDNIPVDNGIIFVGNKIYRVDSGSLSEYLKEPVKSLNQLESNPTLNNSTIVWNKSSWKYVPIVTIEEYNTFKSSIGLKLSLIEQLKETSIFPFDSILYSNTVYTITSFTPIIEERTENEETITYTKKATISTIPNFNLLNESLTIMTVSGYEGRKVISTEEGSNKYHIETTNNIITHVFNFKYKATDSSFYFLNGEYKIYKEKNNDKEIYIFEIPTEGESNYIIFKKEEMFVNCHMFAEYDPASLCKFRLDYENSLISLEENITPHVVLGDLDDSKGIYGRESIFPFRTYLDKSFKLGIYSDLAVFNGAEFRGKWPQESNFEALDYPRYTQALNQDLCNNHSSGRGFENIIPSIGWILLLQQSSIIPSIPVIPLGIILMWYGTTENVPKDWHICDGSTLSESDYPDFTATFGTALPDLRNRFVVGAGDEYSVGNTGGEKAHTLTEGELPSHNHEYSSPCEDSLAEGRRVGTEEGGCHGDSNWSTSWRYVTKNTGSGNSHENRPPYYALYYIIKIK